MKIYLHEISLGKFSIHAKISRKCTVAYLLLHITYNFFRPFRPFLVENLESRIFTIKCDMRFYNNH